MHLSTAMHILSNDTNSNTKHISAATLCNSRKHHYTLLNYMIQFTETKINHRDNDIHVRRQNQSNLGNMLVYTARYK